MFMLRPFDRIIDICTGALLAVMTVAAMWEASERPFERSADHALYRVTSAGLHPN